MMVEWGVPTVYLEAMTYNLCQLLEKKGAYVPDIAIGGGLSTEDHMFKVLAMGAPYVKAVCLGRAIMIPRHGRQEHRQVARAGQAAAHRLGFWRLGRRDIRDL